jgi:hypothetical protein
MLEVTIIAIGWRERVDGQACGSLRVLGSFDNHCQLVLVELPLTNGYLLMVPLVGFMVLNPFNLDIGWYITGLRQLWLLEVLLVCDLNVAVRWGE